MGKMNSLQKVTKEAKEEKGEELALKAQEMMNAEN
jgi:hypothetical protein